MEVRVNLADLFRASVALSDEDVVALVRERFAPDALPSMDDVLCAVALHMMPPNAAAIQERVTHETLAQLTISLRRPPSAMEPVEEPDDGDAGEAPAKKRKEGFDVAATLERLKPLCTPPPPQAQQEAAAAPVDALHAYMDGMATSARATVRLTPHSEFRNLLQLGLYVRTCLMVAGNTWLEISKSLGLREANARSNGRVKRGLVLFHDLVMGAEMYMLRHLQPADKKTIAALHEHSADIAAYLEAHPAEQLWWSGNGQDEPPVVVLPKHNGQPKEWLDKRWL